MKVDRVDVVAPREEQPVQRGEWAGHTSAKFTTWKAHVPAPVPNNDAAHPIYSMGGRRHYEEKHDRQADYRHIQKVGIAIARKEPRTESVKMMNFQPIPKKPEAERRHLRDQYDSLMGPTHDNPKQGLLPFAHANQKTEKEYKQETVMTQKKRTKCLYDQRNGLPLQSLGDKNYKHPDYEPGFFKEGGLITGSTNTLKMKSSGNGKAIDFYSGLKLDQGPLNPNRKTWTQAVKEQTLNEELAAVDSLKDWERGTLKEVDPNYEVDDDSEKEDNVNETTKE